MNFFSEDNSSFSDNITVQNPFPFFTIEINYIFDKNNNIIEEDFNELDNEENVIGKINKINDKAKTIESIKNDFDCSLYDKLKRIEEKPKIPEFYSLHDIKEKFGDMFKGISKDLFKKDSKILEAEYELQSYKIKKIKYDDQYISEEIKSNSIRYDKGRKKGDDITERKHGKYSSDNIIKKIKGILFNNLVVFINKILQKEEMLLRDLNYNKYIHPLQRDKNLKYLHLSIKDLLSLEITPYKSFNVNRNKDIIKKISEEEKNNDVIMYILNMKFRDWINIFTMKEDIKLNIGYEIIQNSLPKITDILKTILAKNDIVYLRLFLLYLYNYEKWFIIRYSRNSKSKSK